MKIIKENEIFILTTQYGKKNELKEKKEEFNNLKIAIKAFKKKFYEKTMNHFESKNQFEEKPGRYTIALV